MMRSKRPVYIKRIILLRIFIEKMKVMGRFIIVAGLVLVGLGVVILLLERLHVYLGRLPGDIVLRSRGGTFYFPLATCILISVLASLVMWLLNRR